MKNLTIGIFGFGCVGQGLWKVLHETRGIHADIKKICIKHPEKQRPIDPGHFTTDPAAILEDPEIDVVVELIDDAEAAFEIVSRALRNGKAVVSANKKMIAYRLPELYNLQHQYDAPFLYEGSCCASIPIIRNLEEYYDNDLLTSVEGIFNGTTNFILTKIFEENLDFPAALRLAQISGFAESDPSLDIEAYDPKYKLCILLLHAFGVFVHPEQVFNFGIGRINDFDIRFARSQGCEIKLIAHCFKSGDRVSGYCLPRFVPKSSRYAGIKNEYNAVDLESAFAESQFFIGKGAGDRPTGSAVLSDISALTYHYKYEYKKYAQNGATFSNEPATIDLYVRFGRENQVNPNDFLEIYEQYAAQSTRYIVGKIALDKLQAAVWLNDPEVNIVQWGQRD
jgi:homoserine dehydrogenase